MMAIMVDVDDNGYFEIPYAAEEEIWDEVKAELRNIRMIDDLRGWGKWSSLWVGTDHLGCRRHYFVSEEDNDR